MSERVRAIMTLRFPGNLPEDVIKLKILSHAPSSIEKRATIWTPDQGDSGTLTVELDVRRADADSLMSIVDEDWVDDGIVLVMPLNATYDSQCVIAKKGEKARKC